MYSTSSQFQSPYFNHNHNHPHTQDTISMPPRPSGPNHSLSNSQLGGGFMVAGMPSSTSGHQMHGSVSSWNAPNQGLGSSLSGPMSDGFGQSRSHYQPGYMMSMSQNSTGVQGNQRNDELPIVQTKAKMNTLKRNTTSEFGKDPMFESSRRHTALDEDAPPMVSVNDIVTATYAENPTRRLEPLASSTFPHRPKSLSLSKPPSTAPSNAAEPIHVIIFGYPADKYSVTVEYFKQIGECTDPDLNTEIVNCFRVAYKNPADAMRAVRKNGEVIGGSWMIGVKYADPAKAASILGPSTFRISSSSNLSIPNATTATDADDSMMVDDLTTSPQGPSQSFSNRQPQSPSSPAPRIGTPLRLEPAASAFRKPGSAPPPAQAAVVTLPSGVKPGGGSAPGTPAKGMLGQVSDLIFGW